MLDNEMVQLFQEINNNIKHKVSQHHKKDKDSNGAEVEESGEGEE